MILLLLDFFFYFAVVDSNFFSFLFVCFYFCNTFLQIINTKTIHKDIHRNEINASTILFQIEFLMNSSELYKLYQYITFSETVKLSIPQNYSD